MDPLLFVGNTTLHHAEKSLVLLSELYIIMKLQLCAHVHIFRKLPSAPSQDTSDTGS
jgi:hypothetical protein